MLGLRPMELAVVLPVLALAIVYCVSQGLSTKRMAIYGLVIVASSVILLKLVEQPVGR